MTQRGISHSRKVRPVLNTKARVSNPQSQKTAKKVLQKKEKAEMNQTKFSYLKWAPIVAGLAIAVLLSIPSSTATIQPSTSDSAAPGIDTSNEEQVIGRYLDDLFSYQIECHQAGRRQALRAADIDPLQRKSDDLKNRLSEVQNAAREIVRKLKAANEFDDLDSKLLARVTDANRRSFFQESSFKADLEYAASNLSSHRDEIALPLDGLRKKVARTEGTGALVMAAYHPTTAMFGVGLGCRIGQIRLKLIERNGGNIANAPATCDAISCACHPKGGGLCTGANCPGVGATQ